MLIQSDNFTAAELAALTAAQTVSLVYPFQVQRKSAGVDALGTPAASWSNQSVLLGALSRASRIVERVEGGELRSIVTWKLQVPVLSDLLPQDRVLQLAVFNLTLGAPSAGTFTLTFGAQTTGALSYAAAAAAVQAALEGLSSIGSGNVSVRGSAGGPYWVAFTGALKTTQGLLTGSGTGLTGGALATLSPIFEVIGTDAGLADASALTAELVRMGR